MARVWLMPLPPEHKLLLLCLADFSNKEGQSWPSIKSLTERTGLSERGIQNINTQLINSGCLRIERGGGRGRSNKYLILSPETPHQKHRFRNTVLETPFLDAINPAPAAPDPLDPLINTKRYNTYSSEPVLPNDSDPPLIEMPTNKTGEVVGIAAKKADEWAETYPGVDVLQTLKEIRQWLFDNASKRKTARGMNSFIGRWMAREQNKSTYEEQRNGYQARRR